MNNKYTTSYVWYTKVAVSNATLFITATLIGKRIPDRVMIDKRIPGSTTISKSVQ